MKTETKFLNNLFLKCPKTGGKVKIVDTFPEKDFKGREHTVIVTKGKKHTWRYKVYCGEF